MIGRLEISEILGMAGTCAALLFAGFSVETLGDVPAQVGVVSRIQAPEIPALADRIEELRLEAPFLVRPLSPTPPEVTRCELPLPERQSAL
jgi:hypothetical protein